MPKNPYKSPEEVREITFAMRVNMKEDAMLQALADTYQRTKSDVVRMLVGDAINRTNTLRVPREVPDLLKIRLNQILCKLDKIEDRLDARQEGAE